MRALKNLFKLLREKRKQFMRSRLSRTTKLFQIELRLANRIGRINFVQLVLYEYCPTFIDFQYFFNQKLFDIY